MERITVDAFVVNNNPSLSAYFAVSKSIPRDLIIGYSYVPNNVDITGKWVRVEVREGNVVRSRIVIIDDLFESHVRNGFAEVKVEIRHDGRLGNIEIYKNDYFGLISDPRKVISNYQSGVSYYVWIVRHKEPGVNSRWRISYKQDSILPDGPKFRDVEGIIHSHRIEGNGYFAWSESEPRNRIFISYDHCPNENLLGAWINMSIDQNNDVQKPVIIIPDLFKTRLNSNFVEILIDFKCVETSPTIFYHKYFGDICDPRNISERPEIGEMYSGWIAYHQLRGTNSRWRLALNQRIEGPLNFQRNETRYGDDDAATSNRNQDYSPAQYRNRRSSSPDVVNEYVFDRRSDSRCSSHRSQHRNDNEYFDSRRNSPGPYKRNNYDDEFTGNVNLPSRSSQFNNDRIYNNSLTDRNGYGENYNLDRNRHHEIENDRNQKSRLSVYEGRSHSNRSRTPEKYQSQNYNHHQTSSSYVPNVTKRTDSRSSSRRSRSSLSRADTSESEDDKEIENREIRNFRKQRMHHSSDVTAEWRNSRPGSSSSDHLRKNTAQEIAFGTQRDNLNSENTDSTSTIPKTSEDLELKRNATKILRIKHMFEFFASNEDIRKQMKNQNLKSFDYLEDLFKK